MSVCSYTISLFSRHNAEYRTGRVHLVFAKTVIAAVAACIIKLLILFIIVAVHVPLLHSFSAAKYI